MLNSQNAVKRHYIVNTYVQACMSLCGYVCVSAGTHPQRPEQLTPLEVELWGGWAGGGLLATGREVGG